MSSEIRGIPFYQNPESGFIILTLPITTETHLSDPEKMANSIAYLAGLAPHAITGSSPTIRHDLLEGSNDPPPYIIETHNNKTLLWNPSNPNVLRPLNSDEVIGAVLFIQDAL